MARRELTQNELRPDERAIDKTVRNEFAFLASLGYGGPRPVVDESPLIGRIISWVFTNQRSDRDCEVLLNCDADKRCDLEVVIWKKSGEEESADPLFLNMYLNSHRPDLDLGCLSLKNYPPPLESQVAEVLRIYRQLLAEEVIDILKGRRWEAGHYTDWTA